MNPTVGTALRIELVQPPGEPVSVLLVMGEMTCTINAEVGVGIGTMLIQYAAVAAERNRLEAESKPRLLI